MTLFIERDYVTIKEMQSHLSNCYYGMFPRGYVAKMLALNGYIDPDRYSGCAYKSTFKGEITGIMDGRYLTNKGIHFVMDNAFKERSKVILRDAASLILAELEDEIGCSDVIVNHLENACNELYVYLTCRGVGECKHCKSGRCEREGGPEPYPACAFSDWLDRVNCRWFDGDCAK